MFVPFEPWHLGKFKIDRKIRLSVARISLLAERGHAFTVVADDEKETEIIGVVGAVPRFNGKSVEVFVVSDREHRDKHPLTLARAVKRVLREAQARYEVVEALGDGSPQINRWLSWLGFEPVESGLWRLA